MTARLLETNTNPLQHVEVDGVTVDIIENALRNAREEMDAVLFRTAMSPGIREQGDCFPMIANKEGKMVVGQFGSFIGPFLEAYDDEIEEGDIILTNDPYMCNAAVSHLPDWVVLVPVFKEGRHIAWSAMFGHMSDNGGGCIINFLSVAALVNLVHLVKGCGAQIGERAHGNINARVVYQYVDLAVVGNGCFRKVVQIFHTTCVRCHRECIASLRLDRVRQCLAGFQLAAGNNDTGAGAGKTFGHGLAQSAAAAGD